MNHIFKPTLEDYGEFAEKIGFKATKIDGVFLYKCGETILRPFELGNLYRLCHLKYSEGVDDCLNTLEYYVKKSKNNKLRRLFNSDKNAIKRADKTLEGILASQWSRKAIQAII